MKINRIYCYFVDIGWAAQAGVVELWKERWKAEGWEPIVLGEGDARQDPRWDAVQAKALDLPCIKGSKGFERVNFERWLAFSQVREPAVVADFDVFAIRPFPPQDFGDLPVSGDGAGGPGFIAGNRDHFSRIADSILNYQVGPDDVWETHAHVSDMSILRKCRPYRIDVMVITYGFPGFGTVPLAHYSNSSLDRMTNFHTGMSKADAIRQLLNEHYVA